MWIHKQDLQIMQLETYSPYGCKDSPPSMSDTKSENPETDKKTWIQQFSANHLLVYKLKGYRYISASAWQMYMWG